MAIRCVMSSDSNRIIYFDQNQKGFTVVDYQSNINNYLISQKITTSGIVRDIFLYPDNSRVVVAQADSKISVY